MQARIYRFIATIFAFAGLIVFLVLYFKNIEGDVMTALSRPSTIAIILVPFLPAAVLAWKAAKIESKFFDLLGSGESGEKKAKP